MYKEIYVFEFEDFQKGKSDLAKLPEILIKQLI